MRKRKDAELEPMPRHVKVVLVVFTVILVALAFVAGSYYLANWKGDVIFLPVALFIGILLVAAVVSMILRASRKRR